MSHIALLALAAAPLLPAGADATSPPAHPGDVEALDDRARIERLEQALRELQAAGGPGGSGWEVGYDKGYYIRSRDRQADPFELRINGRMQFRYASVMPDARTFDNLGTAASGTPVALDRRNDFEIERGRLEFRGTFWLPDLHFYINIDADTDDNHQAIFHDFWVDYEFCEGLDLYAGKAFVPGSREWLGGSTSTLLADRSMATTFFRPDRSLGVWAIGEPLDGLHYRAMVGNGFQTSDLSHSQINEDLMYSGSLWWEPLGDFGSGYADVSAGEKARVQMGTSLTYAQEDGVTGSGAALAESNFLRLDDGTRLTDLGVNHFDLALLSVDAALKWRGFNLCAEAYYRWLGRIRPTGAAPAAFPDSRNESWGGYVGAGYMLVPRCFDVQARVSTVQGDFKDSREFAAGVNWYMDGTHGRKLTLDATRFDGSPVSNSGPNFQVGDDGVMLRLQLQLAF